MGRDGLRVIPFFLRVRNRPWRPRFSSAMAVGFSPANAKGGVAGEFPHLLTAADVGHQRSSTPATAPAAVAGAPGCAQDDTHEVCLVIARASVGVWDATLALSRFRAAWDCADSAQVVRYAAKR
jgi:hypothetical protein